MENQRIRLGKSMLKEALFNLLQNMPIERITIYEICKTADINRSTFYKYYGSQYDLLRDIYNDFFTEIERHVKDEGHLETEDLENMLKLIDAERNKCKTLINSAPQQDFSEKLFSLSVIRTLMKNHTSDIYSARQKEYIRLFFCHGGYAIVRKWLNDDNPESPHEIAELIISLGKVLM